MLLNALEFNNLDFAIYELFSVLDPIVSTICQTISTWLVFLVRVYFPLDLLILKIELNLIPKYVACHHYVLMWQQHGLQPKMLNKTLHQTDQLNHLLVHLYLKKIKFIWKEIRWLFFLKKYWSKNGLMFSVHLLLTLHAVARNLQNF